MGFDCNQKEALFEYDKTEVFISAHYIFRYHPGSAAKKLFS